VILHWVWLRNGRKKKEKSFGLSKNRPWDKDSIYSRQSEIEKMGGKKRVEREGKQEHGMATTDGDPRQNKSSVVWAMRNGAHGKDGGWGPNEMPKETRRDMNRGMRSLGKKGGMNTKKTVKRAGPSYESRKRILGGYIHKTKEKRNA